MSQPFITIYHHLSLESPWNPYEISMKSFEISMKSWSLHAIMKSPWTSSIFITTFPWNGEVSLPERQHQRCPRRLGGAERPCASETRGDGHHRHRARRVVDRHAEGLPGRHWCRLDLVKFNVISWEFVEFHEISIDFMGFSEISWDLVGFTIVEFTGN